MGPARSTSPWRDLVGEGEDLAFDAQVADTEELATALSLSWESDVDGVFSTAGADSSGRVRFAVDDLSVGDHTITGRVTDTDGMSSIATVDVVVNGRPSAPVVSLGPTAPDTADALTLRIDAASVDPEGGAVTYSYAWLLDGVSSAASTSATLPASATTRGDAWTARVTPATAISAAPTARPPSLNVILDSVGHGLYLDAAGTSSRDNSPVVNNTIADASSYGVYIDYYYTSSTYYFPVGDFVNNIVYSSGSYEVYSSVATSSPFTSLYWYNNDVCAGSGSNSSSQIGTHGNVSQNPNFTDEAGEDYSLAWPSAWPSAWCIDQGLSASTYGVSTDYNGRARPQGHGYDMGPTRATSGTLQKSRPNSGVLGHLLRDGS